MKNTYRLLFFFSIPAMDMILLFCSVLLSYGLYRFLGIGQNAAYPFDTVLKAGLLVSLATIAILFFNGAYNKESGILNVIEVKNTVKGITVSFLLFSAVMVLARIQLPRYVIVFSFAISLTALLGVKTILYHLIPLSRTLQGLNRRMLIYGAGELGQTLFKSIASSPKLGIRPVGFVDDAHALTGQIFRSNSFSRASVTVRVLGTGKDVPHLIKRHNVDEVCIAVSGIENGAFAGILNGLRRQGVAISFVPNLYEAFGREITFDRIGQLPLIRETAPRPPLLREIGKKGMDLTLSLGLLILTTPVFLAIAAAIRRDSVGPVFFVHQRIGRNGKPFRLIKFRTLARNTAPYSVNPTDGNDPRITRVGRFLRRTSLDELPQLLNVLKGDMSLVGPRPEMPFIVETYTDHHKKRLAVKPGITGLWQLSCDREKPIHENMDYDLYYIRNGSFFLDIAILLETLVFAFRGI